MYSFLKKARNKSVTVQSRYQDEEQISESINFENNFHDDIVSIYLSHKQLNESILRIITKLHMDTFTFSDISKCLANIESHTKIVFLIMDFEPTIELVQTIETLKQIHSVFIYSPTSNLNYCVKKISDRPIINHCMNMVMLENSIQKSMDRILQHLDAVFRYRIAANMFFDISNNPGSFLFFQLFKILLEKIPKSIEAKTSMMSICQSYNCNNPTELLNIDEFDQSYKSCDAITWFLTSTFIRNFINKVLQIENVYILYKFRFYLVDLTEQIKLKSKNLKTNKNASITLYRSVMLSTAELSHFENNIGKFVSNNEYILATSKYAVSHHIGIKSVHRSDFVCALIEYSIDPSVTATTIIADIRQNSIVSEEEEFIIDIGASFQIISCAHETMFDRWHIKLVATDESIKSISNYFEYQKKTIIDSYDPFVLGDLLINMSKYSEAKTYFKQHLSSKNQDDKIHVSLNFHTARILHKQGALTDAMTYYQHNYDIYRRPNSRFYTIFGRTINAIGALCIERSNYEEAGKYLMDVLKQYTNRPKHIVEYAGTLMNLATIDYNERKYVPALEKYKTVKKIYDQHLPIGHPNQALLKVNFANIHAANSNYRIAHEEYEAALNIQEKVLPKIHLDTAKTLHNLAILHKTLQNKNSSEICSSRSLEIAKALLINTGHQLIKTPDQILDALYY